MPTYIIERTVPGDNTLTTVELRDISAKSNSVVAGLGEPYRWLHSYVAGDKLYCVQYDGRIGSSAFHRDSRMDRRADGRLCRSRGKGHAFGGLHRSDR